MKKNNKGFSLVELIIVIAIMAVLVGLLAPQYLKFVEKSKKSADVSNAQALATAFNVTFADGSIGSGTYNGTTGNVGHNVSAQWPEPKSTSGSWSVVVDENGVKTIKLGGASIYPSPDSSFK